MIAVLNGGYLVQLLFISLLDLVKKGTRMNANELAEDLEGAKLVILRLNATLLQQNYEIQDLAEWKRSLMEVNSQQQAEIEALKAENKEYEKHIAVGVLMRLRKAQEK